MIAHFDTEFQDPPLALASIGVVREDGKTFYRVAAEFEPNPSNWWFMRHVWKKIKDEPKTPIAVIAEELQDFLAPVETMAVKTGGDGSDERLLRSLGCHHPILDLTILWNRCGQPRLPKFKKPHHALQDAFYYKEFHKQVVCAPQCFYVGETVPVAGKKTRKLIRQGKMLDFTTNTGHTGIWERRSQPNDPNRRPRKDSPSGTGVFTTTTGFATCTEKTG